MAPHSRVRDTLRDGGLAPFESAISGLVVRMPQPPAQRPVQPIGVHPLRDGHIAIGIGLPFGHSDAETLTRLIEGAKRAGASGVRTAPGRALLLVGLSPETAADIRRQAGRLGFIVEPSDPRCKVIACAGSPVCASGQIPARSLAAALAQAVQTGSADRGIIHVSGCSKGCAHPAPTPIAVFGREGRCDIRMDGRVSCSVTVEDLPAQIARVLQLRREPNRG